MRRFSLLVLSVLLATGLGAALVVQSITGSIQSLVVCAVLTACLVLILIAFRGGVSSVIAVIVIVLSLPMHLLTAAFPAVIAVMGALGIWQSVMFVLPWLDDPNRTLSADTVILGFGLWAIFIASVLLLIFGLSGVWLALTGRLRSDGPPIDLPFQ